MYCWSSHCRRYCCSSSRRESEVLFSSGLGPSPLPPDSVSGSDRRPPGAAKMLSMPAADIPHCCSLRAAASVCVRHRSRPLLSLGAPCALLMRHVRQSAAGGAHGPPVCKGADQRGGGGCNTAAHAPCNSPAQMYIWLLVPSAACAERRCGLNCQLRSTWPRWRGSLRPAACR